MTIRPYQADDAAALIQLERQSPRGFPNPFIHFRRRFVDRAELYPQALTLVAQNDTALVGVSSIIIKECHIGNQLVKVAYSFDSRVLPSHRQQGIGSQLIAEKLHWAKAQGAVGVYSLVVATNYQSIGMVEKQGYRKSRLIMYLQFQPSPLITPLLGAYPNCAETPCDQDLIQACYAQHDLFVPHLADQVAHLGFQRWSLQDDADNTAGLSVYDQAKISIQIPAEAPYPKTEAEIARLGRAWQIFDVVGMQHADLLHQLFGLIRDEAVMQNVNKLIWMIDRNELVPQFIVDEASTQIDYWLLFKSFTGDDPTWGHRVYLDPRDL